jgi:hypothetical protein
MQKKKNNFLFLVLLLSWSNGFLFGQKSIFLPSEIGLKLGFYSSTIFPEHNYGSGLNDYLFTSANPLGLSLAWQLKPQNYLVLDAEFSKQGQKHEDWKIANDPKYYFQRSIELDYFRLPVYYKHIFDKKKRNFNFYSSTGFYVAYLSAADLTYIQGGEKLDFVTAMTQKNDYASKIYQPTTFQDLFQPFDIGLILGSGIQVLVSEQVLLSTDLRLELGLADINDEDWRFPHPKNGYKPSRNSLFGLKIGLSYRL